MSLVWMRNTRLAIALMRAARNKRLAEHEAERRRAETARRKEEAFGGPPMEPEEYAAAVGEVEARRQG